MRLFEVLYLTPTPLLEATYKDLMTRIDPVFLNQELPRREKQPPRKPYPPWDLPKPGRSGALGGITSVVLTDDTMTFMVPSWDGEDPADPHNFHPQPNKPREYTAKVKFLLWNALKANQDYTPQQKARILLTYPVQGQQQLPRSDIQVSCSCPSFLYWGFQYILTQLGAAIADEGRPPMIRNPKQRGIVCKHLNRVMHVIPFYLDYIAREIGKPGDQTHSGVLPPQQQGPQTQHPQRGTQQRRQPPTPPPEEIGGTTGIEAPPIM